MKIGEAAKRTGLTEKAIRVYVESGLVKPQITQGTHRNSMEFSEDDIRRLEQIAVFRKAGFSVFEISVIQEQPHRLPELIESKRRSMEDEYSSLRSVRETLNRLELSELGDPEQLAQALRPAVEDRKAESDGGSKRWIYVTVSIVMIAYFILTMRYGVAFGIRAGSRIWPAIGTACGGFLALLSLFPAVMAWRYGSATRRAAKMPNRSMGTIISVVEDHRFDGSYARAGSGSAGTREPGIGGMWQIWFMLWNEVRYDCYFPVIHYHDGKKLKTNSFAYGGFKDSFRTGERIEIAWTDQEPWRLYPLEGTWLKKKAVIYGLMALVMILIAAALVLWSGGRTLG